MGSKVVVLICLFLAICTLLVVSEVAEISTSDKKSANGLNEVMHGQGGGVGGYEPAGGIPFKRWRPRPGKPGGGVSREQNCKICKHYSCKLKYCGGCCNYAGEAVETHN